MAVHTLLCSRKVGSLKIPPVTRVSSQVKIKSRHLLSVVGLGDEAEHVGDGLREGGHRGDELRDAELMGHGDRGVLSHDFAQVICQGLQRCVVIGLVWNLTIKC